LINGWCGRTSCATASRPHGRYIWCWSPWPTPKVSYYSEATLSRLLKLDLVQLAQARQQLVSADLLAYQKPLYQVLYQFL
jgi:hypothetical protein